MHWQIEAALISPLIPQYEGLNLDTFDGKAWVSLVGFKVANAHIRHLPPFPGLSSMAELNLRTYVKLGDQPGVVFLNIDTDNHLAASIYRLFGLPYHKAQINYSRSNHFEYNNGPNNSLNIKWQPGGLLVKNPLDTWLTERYCSYQQVGKQIYCFPVCHFPWQLQEANMEVKQIMYQSQSGLHLSGDNMTFAHYARGVEALFYFRRNIGTTHILRHK